MSALEGHLHSKCFHVQLQVVSTKYILAHSSHAEGLSPVCNYHVDLQTLPLRELFCITSTYVSTHSSVSFNLYAVSSKKRINTFIITISSSCVPSFNFLSTTLSSSTTLLTSFSTSWYTTPSIYNPWHALEAHFHFFMIGLQNFRNLVSKCPYFGEQMSQILVSKCPDGGEQCPNFGEQMSQNHGEQMSDEQMY